MSVVIHSSVCVCICVDRWSVSNSLSSFNLYLFVCVSTFLSECQSKLSILSDSLSLRLCVCVCIYSCVQCMCVAVCRCLYYIQRVFGCVCLCVYVCVCTCPSLMKLLPLWTVLTGIRWFEGAEKAETSSFSICVYIATSINSRIASGTPKRISGAEGSSACDRSMPQRARSQRFKLKSKRRHK